MHNSKTRFSNRVKNYTLYRPSYPEDILDELRRKGALPTDAQVADIGSGTGISTRLFLDSGYHCIAVEPNEAMRSAAEEQLVDFDNFTSINGSAEATTLSANSVDLIVAGQAFHWFDQEACKQEFQRILRPGRSVALIWNERNASGTAFQAGYEELLKEYCNDYDQVDYKRVDEQALTAFFAPFDYTISEFPNQQLFDFEGLKGRLLSSSYCPLEGDSNYEPVMQELLKLYDNYQKNGRVAFDYQTRVYLGQLTDSDSEND